MKSSVALCLRSCLRCSWTGPLDAARVRRVFQRTAKLKVAGLKKSTSKSEAMVLSRKTAGCPLQGWRCLAVPRILWSLSHVMGESRVFAPWDGQAIWCSTSCNMGVVLESCSKKGSWAGRNQSAFQSSSHGVKTDMTEVKYRAISPLSYNITWFKNMTVISNI